MAGATAERKVSVAELALRALLCGLAALAAALVATDAQTRIADLTGAMIATTAMTTEAVAMTIGITATSEISLHHLQGQPQRRIPAGQPAGEHHRRWSQGSGEQPQAALHPAGSASHQHPACPVPALVRVPHNLLQGKSLGAHSRSRVIPAGRLAHHRRGPAVQDAD